MLSPLGSSPIPGQLLESKTTRFMLLNDFHGHSPALQNATVSMCHGNAPSFHLKLCPLYYLLHVLKVGHLRFGAFIGVCDMCRKWIPSLADDMGRRDSSARVSKAASASASSLSPSFCSAKPPGGLRVLVHSIKTKMNPLFVLSIWSCLGSPTAQYYLTH